MFSLLIFGCSSTTSLTCKPDWVYSSYTGGDADWCKTICYKGFGTTSIKMVGPANATCMIYYSNGTCQMSMNASKCWCDVNHCGLNETEIEQ